MLSISNPFFFLFRLSNLKILDLSYSLISIHNSREADDKKVQLLASILPHLKKLHSLNLSHNALVAPQIVALLPAFQKLTKLQALDFSSNGIGDIFMAHYFSNKGMKILTLSFPYLPNLRVLNLQSNQISYKAAQNLDTGLPHLKNLRTLNLWYNEVEGRGAEALASTFPHLPQLRNVYLFLGTGKRLTNISPEVRNSLREYFPSMMIH